MHLFFHCAFKNIIMQFKWGFILSFYDGKCLPLLDTNDIASLEMKNIHSALKKGKKICFEAFDFLGMCHKSWINTGAVT